MCNCIGSFSSQISSYLLIRRLGICCANQPRKKFGQVLSLQVLQSGPKNQLYDNSTCTPVTLSFSAIYRGPISSYFKLFFGPILYFWMMNDESSCFKCCAHRQAAGNMVSYGPFPVAGMEGALDRSPQKEHQEVPAKKSRREESDSPREEKHSWQFCESDFGCASVSLPFFFAFLTILDKQSVTSKGKQSQSTTTFDKSLREKVWCLFSTNPVRAKITLILSEGLWCKCSGHADEVLKECHMLFASNPKKYETSEKRCRISFGANNGMMRDTP